MLSCKYPNKTDLILTFNTVVKSLLPHINIGSLNKTSKAQVAKDNTDK